MHGRRGTAGRRWLRQQVTRSDCMHRLTQLERTHSAEPAIALLAAARRLTRTAELEITAANASFIENFHRCVLFPEDEKFAPESGARCACVCDYSAAERLSRSACKTVLSFLFVSVRGAAVRMCRATVLRIALGAGEFPFLSPPPKKFGRNELGIIVIQS